MSTDTQPNTPAGWQVYASMNQVAQIPATAGQDRNENASIETYRDIYLDGTEIVKTPLKALYIYTDVLAFTEKEVILSPVKSTTMEINTRVLTANEPMHLNMSKAGAESCAVMIYASVVDQPISVSVEGSQLTTLDLGAQSDNVGAEIVFIDGQMTVTYDKTYDFDSEDTYQACIDTQLRIALALFWSRPAIAISICSHVAKSTATGAPHGLANTQAVALGQQLAAQAMVGPDSNYAPVLTFQTYHDTMEDQLAAAMTFEKQYQQFQNKENSVEDQRAAWGVMLKNAGNQRSTRAAVQDQAWNKYQDACSTVETCSQQLEDDNEEVQDKQTAFEEGLRKWEQANILKAVFGILGAIFGFAFGIAKICMGDNPLGSAKDVEDAIEKVEKVEEGAQEMGQILNSKTMQNVLKCVKALNELYPKISDLVDAVKKLPGSKGDVDIPPIGDISGSGGTDADSSLIMTLAAWDKWELDCDQQMEFAMEQNIEGASEYRLALRKHAVNGRALAQAQTEAINQGQQYVQATLEVYESDQDIQNLQDLMDIYTGEEEIYAQAEAKFFDRFLALKTTLVIQLQYMVDAYRYYALQDSLVALDSQKSVGDFQDDLSTLQGEMQNVDGQYAEGFTPFDYNIYSDELPSNYGQLVIDGLTSSSQKYGATFTLAAAPDADPSPGENNFAYPFTNGSHYRLDGLETLLQDVKPKHDAIHDGRASVSLKIETSGLYSDIQHDQVFHFVSQVQEKRYSYEIDADGNFLRATNRAIFDPTNHAEPTPFTQWTITLETPENVDLSTIKNMEFHWVGKYRPY